MKPRAYGFYWVRIRSGDGDLFVAEYATSVGFGKPAGWDVPGSESRFAESDIEVVSERLVPPAAKAMS